jgi:tRNA-splicing ligase RtcB
MCCKIRLSIWDHTFLQGVAQALIEFTASKEIETIALIENPNSYSVFGAAHIEQGAIDQMEVAMKLPVTVAGALMPDAHQGVWFANWWSISYQ